MIVNNILSRVLLGILTGCCLLACRGELPVLPSDEIDVGKDPLGAVSYTHLDVYKRQVDTGDDDETENGNTL